MTRLHIACVVHMCAKSLHALCPRPQCARSQPSDERLRVAGRLNQFKRMGVFYEFCEAKAAVLFATDIAARGLDFPHVDWVLQVTHSWHDCLLTKAHKFHVLQCLSQLRCGVRACRLHEVCDGRISSRTVVLGPSLPDTWSGFCRPTALRTFLRTSTAWGAPPA